MASLFLPSMAAIVTTLFLSLCFLSLSVMASPVYHRHLLHQPFFPWNSLPPMASAPQSTQPKLPFSSITSYSTPPKPFFPSYASSSSSSSPPPQPSPSTALPTFPANISALLFPQPSLKPHHPNHLFAIAISLSLFSFILFSLLCAFLLFRRTRSHKPPMAMPTDNLPLYPPHIVLSDGVSTNPLIHDETAVSVSPDLNPLPPLPRHFLREDSDEEFFSPRGSEIQFGRRSFNSVSMSNTPLMSPNSKSPDSIVTFPAPLRPFPSLPVPSSSPSLSSSSYSSPPHRDSQLPPPPPAPPSSSGPPLLAMASRPIVLQSSEVAGTREENLKPRLKALHWDKVGTSSDRAMVWDRIKCSSFELNEEMIESLFMANNSKEGGRGKGQNQNVGYVGKQENGILDPKKSQNIAILLRALNITIEEVSEALLEGNLESLGTELLESLLKMAPTKEEERKLKEYKHESPLKLGAAEKFLKVILDLPFAFKRVEAMLYIANFYSEIDYLERSFQTLQAACKELKNSRMFLKLLEAVLKTGNRMNVGTNRGDAHAFKLDTLLKLVDVKAADGKTTLLHFVVQEIIKAEGYCHSSSNQPITTDETQLHSSSLTNDIEFRKLGLQVVSGLSRELSSVKKAAVMDADVLSSDMLKLAGGIAKVTEVVKLNKEMMLNGSGLSFADSMNKFLAKAADEIERVKTQEGVVLGMVKEITEYFHGNSAKEEARPLRIFMVVRDFLAILDRVCKEVGRINERTIVSSARQFTAAPNPIPVVFPGLCESLQYGSSDDDSSSSSS